MANGKRHIHRRAKRTRKGPAKEVCKWKNIDGVRTRVCKPIKQKSRKR